MSIQNDLISSLTRGFPKGKKVNRSVPVSEDLIENIHTRLREKVTEQGLKYHDILNELKVMERVIQTEKMGSTIR